MHFPRLVAFLYTMIGWQEEMVLSPSPRHSIDKLQDIYNVYTASSLTNLPQYDDSFDTCSLLHEAMHSNDVAATTEALVTSPDVAKVNVFQVAVQEQLQYMHALRNEI